MSNIDLYKMAIRNLLKRKLRTFLTVLGVIIGTAAIVVMVSLGIGMNQNFESQVQSLSSLTQISVSPLYGNGEGPMSISSSANRSSSRNNDSVLDDNMISNFKQMSGVIAVTPVENADVRIVDGKYETWAQVRGIDPNTMEAFGFKLAEGRLLETDDKTVAVFGGNVKNNFWNPNQRFWSPYQSEPEIDLMNDKLTLVYTDSYDESPAVKKHKPIKIEAVGILEESYDEYGWSVFMPLDEVKKINELQRKYRQSSQNSNNRNQGSSSQNGYSYVLVKCNKMKDVLEVQEKIKELGFEAYSPAEYIQSMQQTSLSLQMLLGAIGAVSLLVAAIGITNTMMMAIYERTREIGIMKVIGAALRDIKRLFLFEAALIGLLGGLFGIGVSLLLSYLLNSFGISFVDIPQFTPVMGEAEPPDISVIPVWLCALGMCFSTVIGILSGYFPARRAMKLSALTAIRTE